MNNHRMHSMVLTVLFALTASGCASYRTPGAGLSMGNLAAADADIAELMKREPAAAFPARLAIVRVQATGYFSNTNRCYGRGSYCVVTTRDVEQEEDLRRLAEMPNVAAVAPVGRILLPPNLESVKDIRLAAAGLKTDIVVVYSLDTRFNIESADIGPLALVSLGFIPNKKAHVTTTASAALFDVRTGFVFGTAEATASEQQRATMWSSEEAVDKSRLKTEVEAFRNLLGEIEKLWAEIGSHEVDHEVRI